MAVFHVIGVNGDKSFEKHHKIVINLLRSYPVTHLELCNYRTFKNPLIYKSPDRTLTVICGFITKLRP